MQIIGKLKTDLDDFRRGFNDGVGDGDGSDLSDRTKAIIAPFSTFSRMLLFGFLLAMPGLPFLPWGNGVAIALTLAAGIAASTPLGPNKYPQYARAILVLVLVVISRSYGGEPTTSIVLAGAFITTFATLAQNVPMMYGYVAGIALGGFILGNFDIHVYGDKELLLSREAWTSDLAVSESLRMAAVLFLSGLLYFSGKEMKRYDERARDALRSRDRAVIDERARIARELHDVVSHHVTAMTLQAEAAAMTGDKDALTSVASAGRNALTELRRMLGVLRHPDGGATNALTPQPDLRSLDELAARTSTGPRVRVDRQGDVRDLSAGLELGVYRLVQEALTNSAKHGDATTVDVVLTYRTTELVVDIKDDGRPLAAARVGSGGLGLIGMRERVALLDGTLDTGPRADAPGFRVHAVLPIEP